MIPQLAPRALAGWLADGGRAPPLLVDVREPWELAICALEGAVAIPIRELARRRDELPRDRELVLVCHHGVRSQAAALLLAREGFARVHNLQGGLAAWADEVDPALPRY